MTNNKDKQPTNTNPSKANKPVLNEKMGFCYSSSLKISDKKTGEILVQMRCD